MAANDKVNCEKCKRILNLRTGKRIVYDGDCKLPSHMACVVMPAKEYDEYLKDPSVFWFCDLCLSLSYQLLRNLQDTVYMIQTELASFAQRNC